MAAVDDLLIKTLEPRNIQEKDFFSSLLQLFREGHLAVEAPLDAPEFSNPYILREGSHFYLRKTFNQETLLLKEIERLYRIDPFLKVEGSIENERLLEPQRKAITLALAHSLSIITGGPGTGKTYTAGHLIRTLLEKTDNQLTFVLAAPTGKACAQLKSSLLQSCSEYPLPSHRVMTLHSLLETEKEISLSVIPEDLVLVDEASMIDIDLFGKLLSRIKNGGRLVLLGDPNQLPPVETAPIFPEMVEIFKRMGRLGGLESCMRAENKDLIVYAEQLLRGAITFPIHPLSLFSLNTIPLDPLPRILTPLKKGPYGVDAINQTLFNRLLLVTKGSLTIPIMITKNDFSLRLFNGEGGSLTFQTQYWNGSLRSTKHAVATFFIEGVETRFPVYELPPFDLAFALSVHKSQGSAFDHPILLLPPGTAQFGKELLYTALTRSKKGITTYGESQEIQHLLKHSSLPKSTLSLRLKKLLSKQSEGIV